MGFISSSPSLFQQCEVIVSRDGRGLEIMSDDGYRDFIIGRNDHGPLNASFHVRAVASFLARKAKPRSQKDLLEESLRDGGDSRHSHTAMAVGCLSIASQ